MGRIAAALRTAIRLSGVSYRQIERDLEMGTGYLTRILAGQVKLRLTHVLSICQVIGLPAGQFFSALYPPRAPANEGETRLTRGLAQLHPEPLQPGDPETLLATLRAFLEQLEGHLRERK
ncbi:MAG TPA: hypothetical protein VEW48_03525 [Thermoanaerobaculia bacterium]|nr:hypothetical protein [Thermoanaerobaculia bacterium]